MSELLKSGQVGHRFRPMTEQERKEHKKRNEEHLALLAITFERKVLFEKYQSSKWLI